MKLVELTQSDIADIEDHIRRDFMSVGILITFTKHFGDRVVDNATDEKGFKRDTVTVSELKSVFENLKAHHRRIFVEAADYNDELKRGEFQGVIMDILRKINIPFALEFDKRLGKYILTCKTILKRENFYPKPSDHVIAMRGKKYA